MYKSIGETLAESDDLLIGRIFEITQQEFDGDFTKLHVRDSNVVISVNGVLISHSTSESLEVETTAVCAPVLIKEILETSFTQRITKHGELLSESLELAFPDNLKEVIDRDIAIAFSVQVMNDDRDLPVVQVNIQRA